MRLLRERPRPFVYAVVVHLVLLAVLIFSLDWAPSAKPGAAAKKAPVQAVVVDAARVDAEIQRQKEQEEKKQREAREQLKRVVEQAREAERKRKQEEQRAADLKRQRELQARKQAEVEKKRQAELAAKKKAEAERKRLEEQKRKAAEAEKKRQEEEARKKAEAEKKRQEEEARKKAEAEKKRKEEEARRKAEAERKRREDEARKAAEAEMQARLAAEQEALASQRRGAMQSMVNEYVAYIQQKVQRSWIHPPSSGAELSCTVEVRLIPSGEVIDAQIVRSSGDNAFDRSVEAAVFKASPLPVPPDPEVMQQFRSLRFEFKPGSV
jgi:colicin import membrane protein